MHVRRDLEKYPEIEKIIKWAEESVIRSFINESSPSQEELFELVSEFTPEMKQHVIEMANTIGFPLTSIDTFENIINRGTNTNNDLSGVKLIMLEEKEVEAYLFFDNLSSGMYRTILLLLLIEQLTHLKHPALIAIDDLGEGLDYSRATKVGKLLFKMCEENNVQLIATSNEQVMMNIVDINQWNILVRKGTYVKSITSAMCPKEFEEFKFSGLSNFDFFTSDFLNRISLKLFDGQQ